MKGAATPKRDLEFEKAVVSMEKHPQEFTIVGIRLENILAAKTELGGFCFRESANGRISGMEFSDIIKGLNTSQVMSRSCYFSILIKLPIKTIPGVGHIFSLFANYYSFAEHKEQHLERLKM